MIDPREVTSVDRAISSDFLLFGVDDLEHGEDVALELVERLIRKHSRLLSMVPWALSEEVAECRACDGCPFRSGAQTSLLPGDVDSKDRCLDQSCFGVKFGHAVAEHVREVVASTPGAQVFCDEMEAALKKGDFYKDYYRVGSRPHGLTTTKMTWGDHPLVWAELTGEENAHSKQARLELEQARTQKRERVATWARGLDEARAGRVLFGLLVGQRSVTDAPCPEDAALGDLLAWLLTSTLDVGSKNFDYALERLGETTGEAF